MSSRTNPYSGLPETDLPASQGSFASGYSVNPYHTTESSGPNWPGVVIGAVIGTGALLISLASFEGASSAGGTYVVFYGAVIGGYWIALKNLLRN